MHVSLLTREYPPEVYGGAGVHVEYLARELRDLVDLTVHCFGARARTVRRPTGRGTRAGANPRAADDVGRPRHGRRRRGRRGRPLAHVVRELRRATCRSSSTASRTSRRRTASSRCGRGRRSSSAAATPLVVLRAHRARERRRGRRRLERDARRRPRRAIRQSSPPRSRSSTTGSTRSEYRPDPDTDVLERHGVDPDAAVRPLRRPHHAPEGDRRTCSTRRSTIDPAAQLVLCAGAPDTPEIGARGRGALAQLRAQRERRRLDRGDARRSPR